MNLTELGWNEFFQQQLEKIIHDEEGAAVQLIPARVSRQDLSIYHLWSVDADLTAILPGRMYQTSSKADLPTVGDWVLVEPLPNEPGKSVIRHLLKRQSKFSRKEAWTETDEQIVASNINQVFIVSGLDEDFNPSRIERYLLLAWESGSSPVIVLNKADLCEDLEEKMRQLEAVSMGTAMHVVSALSSEGMDVLLSYLSPGHTIALMGSSGVGKSTIVNQLLGYKAMDTGAVREDDSKGKHTTTFRQMFRLASGGILIDTPGMREIQLWGDEESLAATFDDVETLATACRFSDCNHSDEPGCAILEAIDQGKMDESRLRSYRKLQRELKFLAEKQDESARRQGRAERRRFGKARKKVVNKRDR